MKTIKILLITIIFTLTCCGRDDELITVEPAPASNLAISSISPTSGSKNTTVILKGVDFSSSILGNIVTLNGMPCEVNTASSTILSITIPRGAGSGNISVTVAGSTVQSPNFRYLITSSMVSTSAGSTSGFANGAGTAARFDFPYGVAVDASGNVYVADTDNHKIRKISPTGEVTTFAGSSNGFANGTGTAAQFSFPAGIVIDDSGTLYVADYNNHKIRKISTNGVVTTLAGSTAGFANGSGAIAQFNRPYSVAVDNSGTVYVADFNNHKIRKITPTGVVTTLAGSTIGFADGLGNAAQFNYPIGVAVDSQDNVYVADYENNRIRKISPAGIVTTFAGSSNGFANGTGTAAQFSFPACIVIDGSGIMYVADYNNHKIRKITPTGVVTTLAGGTIGFADGITSTAKFDFPTGVAIDALGNVYIADQDNHKIRIITQD